MEKINNFVLVTSLCGLLCGVTGQFDWRNIDAFGEIRDKIDTTKSDTCFFIDDLYLPKDTVSHYPDVKDFNVNPVFPNRTAMVHVYNMAMNRAFFWSYALQSRIIRSGTNDTNVTNDPGMMYYFLSVAADVASYPFISTSAIYFSPNMSYTPSYKGFFNKTLPQFAPRAYRDILPLQTADTLENTFYYIIEDLGAFDKVNHAMDYTSHNYRTNEFYSLWLPDKVGMGHEDTKTTYQVEITYADNTIKTFTFYGPPGSEQDPGPVSWSRPYYDCGRLNKWLVSAVSPVADIYPRHTQMRDIEYPRYTAAVVVEMDYDKIDINQCPPSQGNDGPNRFASTARCKLETTECEPIHGWGFHRGGYQCRCRPGLGIPNGVSHPFPGELIENTTYDQYINNFDCISFENVNRIRKSHVDVKPINGPIVDVKPISGPIVDVKVTNGQIVDITLKITSLENVNATNVKVNGSPLDVNMTGGPFIDIKITNAPIVDIKVSSGSVVDVNARKGPLVDTTGMRGDFNATSGIHEDINAAGGMSRDVNTTSAKQVHVNATKASLININPISEPLIDIDSPSEPNLSDTEKANIEFIKRVRANRDHCYTYRPYELVLNDDVDFGQEVYFEYQAKAAVRLSNFLSAFLQLSDPNEVYSDNRVADKPLTEDQMFGETLSIVATNSVIIAAGIYWDKNKFPNKTFFAPMTYKTQFNTRKFKSEDLARLKDTDDFYMDKEWFALLKQKWSSNDFDKLEKHFLKMKFRNDELGVHLKKHERYPTLYKAASLADGYWSHPYFDCEGPLKRWVITYMSPFFGWDTMKTKLEFKGGVGVSMPLIS